MLRELIQTRGIEVNTLLDPAQLREMKIGVTGSLQGIGVVIDMEVAGLALVRGVLPDGPAARAGLQVGDRILAVDGTCVRQLDLAALVSRIRGPSGSTVELYVQREDREWHQPVVRGQVSLDAVTGGLLEGGVGYVRVNEFRQGTAAQLDELLQRLLGEGGRSVVLDLRACPGGLLDEAVAVADRFLAPGLSIVTLQRRQGQEEHRVAELDHPGDGLPVVVRVDGATASGAEIVASALAEHGRATLVGEPTLGKGTAEEIFELRNGWGLKLSVARFTTAGGRRVQGEGVRPDFVIPAPGTGKAPPGFGGRLPAPADDPQLAAALGVLRLRLP